MNTAAAAGEARPGNSIDAYLAAVPEPARSALEGMRATIREAAPEAIETISYGVPTFKLHGNLVGFAAFKKHCSFFPMSGSSIEAFQGQLEGFSTSKGTIRFTPDKPIPESLLRDIVAARIAENEGRGRVT